MLKGSECSMSWNAEGMPQSAFLWLRPQFIGLLMAWISRASAQSSWLGAWCTILLASWCFFTRCCRC